MTQVAYNFSPIYGFEDHAKVNGLDGAKFGNDNLCITTWFVDDKSGDPAEPLIFGDILVPNYANDVPVGGSDAAAYRQGMKSRTSCWAYYLTEDKKSSPVVCMVLHPPQEYRQQMVDAVVFNGGDPTDIANFTVKKPLQGNYAWRVNNASADGSGQNFMVEAFPLGLFSNYLPVGGPQSVYLPFLKTNGADGVAPEFFDASTAGGMQEMISAVNLGEFYIAMVQAVFSALDGQFFGVTWPHSAARG
jgi:hypothetical protein